MPNVARQYLQVEAYLTKPVEAEHLVSVIRQSKGAAGRILVVDDDAGFRSLMERVMAAAFPAAATRSCASAEEALALLERQRFDVLILDLVMEGMGGVAFLSRARESGLLTETKVFITTGAPYVEELTAVLSPKLRFSKKAMARGTEWFRSIKVLLDAAPPDYSRPAADPAL